MAMSAGEEQQRRTSNEAVTIGRFRYVRAPRPLHFPEHEQVPETKWHLELKTLVYQFLKVAFADQAQIGCDQFVYWDAANPRMCLAPDAFLRFGGPDELFGSWKVWERGAPHVAVENISDHAAREAGSVAAAEPRRTGPEAILDARRGRGRPHPRAGSRASAASGLSRFSGRCGN